MKYEFNVGTEGVLILCSQQGIKEYHQDKAFDYDYPEGILPLINAGQLLAFTTESGDPVCLQIWVNESPATEHLRALGTYQIEIRSNDTWFLFDHGTFTQICDWHKGDVGKYDFDEVYNPKVTLPTLSAGWYKVQAYGQELDFDEKECYAEILLDLKAIAHKEDLEVDDVAAI